jgi:hypothetical protein
MDDVEKSYQDIKKSVNSVLRDDFFELCSEYARIRARWVLMERDMRLEIDQTRRATHNALISSANALARSMRALGENAQWRDNLGNNRRQIGDFACFIACCLALDGA